MRINFLSFQLRYKTGLTLTAPDHTSAAVSLQTDNPLAVGLSVAINNGLDVTLTTCHHNTAVAEHARQTWSTPRSTRYSKKAIMLQNVLISYACLRLNALC